MARYKNHTRATPEEDGLLVFGYSSRIYQNDSNSELMAGESHLQRWPLDEDVLMDRKNVEENGAKGTTTLISPNTRFDVRLLLSMAPVESKGRAELNREEEKMEKECEEERWRDLHDAELASLKRMEEEEYRPKKAEFAFSYTQPAADSPSSSKVVEEDSDSEDEPFIPPSGIKLPVGLETPENQKLNHVIERTALFVVKQGPQMEIVIKAKQRNNQEQFGFLHFDHLLNPYYKYIMKLIREGKYTPDIEPKKKKNGQVTGRENGNKENGVGLEKKASTNALTALMSQHHGSDSDSDSDCELHPSLLAGSRRGGSPDPVDKGHASFAGPQRRPKTPPPTVMRSDYRIETANDTYSTLFKNIAKFNVKKEEEEEKKEEKVEIPVTKDEETEESQRECDDFTQWFISFYGMSPPLPFCNMPYIPPPPDMEKALSGYARYVGENGAEAEFALKGRVELQLHFLAPSNPHHLYYLSAVRRAQWEKSQEENFAMMSNAVLAPPPPLNRKQRRMAFMDAPLVSSAPLPSVVDPAALMLAAAAHSYETPIVRSASPARLSTVVSSPYSSPHPNSPAPLAPPPPMDSSSLTLLPCPVPPLLPVPSTIGMAGTSQAGRSNEILTERQLKARLFMEKILNDKRKKKEEMKTTGVEGMEEGEILENEEKEGKEGRRERREGRDTRDRREKEKEKEDKKAVSTSFIDTLIKSKMDALLKETVPGSLAVEKKNEEIKESKRAEDEKEKEKEKERGEREEKRAKRHKERKEEKEREREERKKKREKKDKRRRRSSSRSSSDEDRKRRRRRSRSRSSELPSKYRRR